MSRHDENIEESIRLILGTAPGERLMRPEFGCAIHDLIFAPNNAHTHGLVKFYVKEAIQRWEPRVQNVTVDVRADGHDLSRVVVDVGYRVIATNNVFNLVYPFYLEKEA
ncbi:MAG: GPW/gp25 family protein [Planctomycetes bacterium]|nr:GPW/gp25 family protein [Planctomycetota bacterium]